MTMKILDQKEWNELISSFRFNSILSVIGDYPLYLEKPSNLIYTNPGKNDNRISLIMNKPLKTEINIGLIDNFIEHYGVRQF